MTGAGFAGCAVALVREASVDAFCEAVEGRYRAATEHEPALYPVRASDGAGRVEG
jgi:galactokinase